MSVTAIQGVVENGRVRLAPTVHLPEGASVYVVVPEFSIDLPARTSMHIQSPRLADQRQAHLLNKEVTWEE
jgi:hypothetical protein